MTSQIRYVGKSNKPKKRYSAHIKAAENGVKNYVYSWIKSLLKKGRKPILIILQHYVPLKLWRSAEQFWVQYYKDRGYKLTNLRPAGIGVEFTEETRKKMSASASIAQKKKWENPEIRKKMIESQKGRIVSEETKRKIGDGNRGRVYSEDRKQIMSEIGKKIWERPGYRERMSEAQKKYFRENPEARERVGEAGKGRIPWNKGIPMTDETKKKASEIGKKIWERPGHRKRMSEVHRGQTPWNKGKKFVNPIKEHI